MNLNPPHLPTRTRSPRANAAAFSIIELLVVIAIIAVLISIALPAVKAISRDTAAAQAKVQVRAMISQAREIARQQRRQAGVVFFEETSQYALPVHAGTTAMQLFIEDPNQAQYDPTSTNTVFIPYSLSRTYLPGNIRLAVLNDRSAYNGTTAADRAVITGDEDSPAKGRTRAILFDGQGRLILRTGLARPDLGTGDPGTYPKAQGDWKFTTKRGTASIGESSPGIFLYDATAYLAQNIPTDDSGNLKREQWIKQNATVIVVNAQTGGFVE